MNIKEIIERKEVHINEILYVIKEYIFEKKRERVKINSPSNAIYLQMAMNAYNNYAAPYFMKNAK